MRTMLLEKLNDLINGNEDNNTMVSFCRYVKEHIVEIPDMTLDELAEKTFISRGQISKSVRRIGYENYNDFRDACRAMVHSLSREKKIIDQTDTIAQAAERVLGGSYKSVQYMLTRVSFERMEQLLEKVKTAETVYLFGRGEAHLDCYILERGLSRAGIACVLCDAEYRNAYTMKEQDMLVFFSVNGDTFHYDKRIVRKLEESRADKWLVTCHPSLSFRGTQLVLPVKDVEYNSFVMRFFVDLCVQLLMK